MYIPTYYNNSVSLLKDKEDNFRRIGIFVDYDRLYLLLADKIHIRLR